MLPEGAQYVAYGNSISQAMPERDTFHKVKQFLLGLCIMNFFYVLDKITEENECRSLHLLELHSSMGRTV